MSEYDSSYQRQVQAQIDQYSDSSADMHDLPPIAHYINGAFLAPRMQDVFGFSLIADIFANELLAATQRTQNGRIASLGAGDCALEINIAKRMAARGGTEFELVCYELSPVLANRGRAAIAAAGVADLVQVVEQDLNAPVQIDGIVAGFMAHHSLHHIVGLELLFDMVCDRLHYQGSFIAADMIGRNGHARWPETLGLVRQIWTKLPDRLKFDRMYGRLDRWFENRDCSIEGFEGIRAQDILPLLLQRFSVQKFLAWGGLMDVFVDRCFGPNYRTESVSDRAFLDSLQAAEDRLLQAGTITPTSMLAVFAKSGRAPVASGAGLSPVSCVRPTAPSFQPREITLASAGVTIPYEAVPAVVPFQLPLDTPISLGTLGAAEPFLRWGWSDPDVEFRWGVGESSALEFACAPGSDLLVELRVLGYLPSFAKEQRITVRANGETVGEALIEKKERAYRAFSIKLRRQLLRSGNCLLEFFPSVTRRPDIEGGEDKRPITFALLGLTASNANGARSGN